MSATPTRRKRRKKKRACPTPKKVKPPRSHWDMLRERRSIADLEQVLAERLALIRGERGIDGDGKNSQRKSA